MTGYHVMAVREGDRWTADVPSLPGAHTWARRIDGLDASVREVIALVLDLPEGAEAHLELDWSYSTGDKALDRSTARLRRDREALDSLSEKVGTTTAELAEQMSASYSVRDIAALLGVSYQRVSQLAPKRHRLSARVRPSQGHGPGSV